MALRFIPRVVRATQRKAAVPRYFSSELTTEQKENEVILASMERMREKAGMVVGLGPQNLHPADDHHNLPANVAEVATLDHTPKSVSNRTVMIHNLSKSAMTSGMEAHKGWRLYWKPLKEWTNPLTGWTSSGDPMTSIELVFDTKEQAIDFATKKGLNYEIKERPQRRREYGTNYYAHNFLPAAYETQLKNEGTSTKLFDNPKANSSHYFRPLTFHGDGPSRQHGESQDVNPCL